MEDQAPPSGGEVELRYWETPEYREKYSQADRDKMAGKEAMPDGSYPIADAEDLDNAIHAVGRGGSDHDAIRRHVISRAKALGLSGKIPGNWGADGSLKQTNARQQRKRGPRPRAVPLSPEVRYFAPTNLELRREARADTDEVILTGSPIVYGQAYRVVDMFGEFSETIHRGAVSGLLGRGVDCRFLINHEGLPLARTTAGTMRLWDTAEALMFEARFDMRQQLANDFVIAVERGDLSQMSVGMIVGDDDWGYDGEAETRDIFGLNDLMDVSGVTYPCSPTTHLEVAQRMLFAAPIESRARLRRMEVELRAGAVLSKTNMGHVLNALAALHTLAEAGGVDPNALGPNGDSDEPSGHEDASDSGPNIEADASITYPDSSGQRADESGVEQRDIEEREEEEAPEVPAPAPTMKASTLRLLVEAGRKPA